MVSFMASPIVKATMQAVALSIVSNVVAQLISCYQAGARYKLDAEPLAQFVTYTLLSCPPNYLWQVWLESTFPGYTSAGMAGTMDSITQDPRVKSVTEKTGPALQSLNEKAGPALQTLNEKASAASTAIEETEVFQNVKRRATEGVETVKAKAQELEARSGVAFPKKSLSQTHGVVRAQTFSTPNGQAIEKTTADSDQVQPEGKVERDGKKLNIKNTAIKFALDQTLGAVINNAMFIAGISALRGKPLEQIVASVRSDFLPLLFAGQKLWPAVSIISFTLVPLEHRTLFGGLVGVGWGIFLSLVAGGKK